MNRDKFNCMNQKLLEVTARTKKDKWKLSSCTKYYNQMVVPESLRPQYVALETLGEGKCLYSSASLMLCGENDLVEALRFLTSWELYQNADYYSDHPLMHRTLRDNSDLFRNEATIFTNYISEHTFNTVYHRDKKADSVREEAAHCLQDGVYASFICVLALSSVIQRGIEIHYSSPNENSKYSKLYDHLIMPRECVTGESIDICWISTRQDLKPNHFIPISFQSQSQKSSLQSKPKRPRIEQDYDTECSPSPSFSPPFSPISPPQPLSSEIITDEAQPSLISSVPTALVPAAVTTNSAMVCEMKPVNSSVGSKFDIGLFYNMIDS